MNKKTLLLLIPFAAAALAGCSPTNPKPQCETADVTISKSSAQVKVGESIKLTAESSIEGCTIAWSSSNESIATVDQEGNVHGVAEGECKIIAGNAECSLTVYSEDKPTPAHAGTLEDPFDGADAVLIANSLESGDATEHQYYIKGTVVSLEETFNPTFGNYSFKIDGGFICWRLKNGSQKEKFEDGDIEVGDKVTVYAYIQKFHKDGEEDKPETKEGYVHSVEKEGPVVPSLKLDKTAATVRVGKQTTITATVKNSELPVNWSIEGSAARMDVSQDRKSVTITGVSVGKATVKASLLNTQLEEECVITVQEPAPEGEGAVYSFTNDKTEAQNWKDIGEAGFLKATVLEEGSEIITGYKDGSNAYIGANGGSGDGTWDIWNSLKVGKSSAQGQITIKLDSSAEFDSIKMDVIGSRDDGELTVNNITKPVTKKAVKGDLEPMELEYDISGGIDELVIKSKDAKSNNYAITITRIEFVKSSPTPKELVSISASGIKTSYVEGETLDLTGLKVMGHYSDESSEEITEGITTSIQHGDVLSLEDTDLVVSAQGLDAHITLSIREAGAVLTGIRVETETHRVFYVGDEFEPETIMASYDKGNDVDVTEKADFSGFDSSVAVASQTINVSYEEGGVEKTAFYTVEIKAKPVLSSIEVTNQPSKTDYTEGETFDPTGMVVMAHYTEGKVDEDVTSSVSYSTEALVVGQTSIEISYTEGSETKTDSVSITVAAKQREALPYSYTISGGKLAEPWVADPNAGTDVTSFSNTYINIKKADKYIEAKQLINAVNEVRVTLVAGGNGSAGSILTIDGLDDNGDKISGATNTIAVASKASLTVADLNDEATYGATVSLSGTGITGFRITLSTRVANTVIKSIKVQGPAVKVNSVELDKEELNLEYPGSGATLNATVLPEEAENKEVEWSVEGSSVSVENGVVTPIAVGESTVTATAKDGSGKSDSCVVTVTSSSKVLESIAVTTPPDKTSYDAGELFDPTGMVVTATYEGGETEPITDYSYPTEPLVAGQTSVAISYGGKNTSVTITVVAPKGSTVDNPFSVAEVIEACKDLGNNEWLENRVYVQGKVKGFAPSSSNKYTLTDGENDFIVYKSELPTDFDRACINDTAIFYGWVENYHPQSGANTLEMTSYNDGTHSDLPITAKIVERGTSKISLDSASSTNADVVFEETATNAASYSFTVTAKEGYEVSSVKFDGVVLEGEDGIYTVEKVLGNAKILVATVQQGQDIPTTVSKTIATIASNNSWKDSTRYDSFEMDDNISVSCSSGTNTGKYYSSDNSWRIYANESGTVTIAAASGLTIQTVKITYSQKDNGTLLVGGKTVTSGSVIEVDASSLVVNASSTSGSKGKVLITAIEVIYIEAK